MQETSKYTELALSHKWVALARLWLENNTPCDRSKMFIDLGMLMPDTIRRSNDRIVSKGHLVRNAYSRIYGSGEIPEVIGRPPKISCKLGYTHEILTEAQKRPVRKSDFPHIKHANSFFSQLRKKGKLVKNLDGSHSAVDQKPCKSQQPE
jgi:hypothetical protein